MADRKLADVMSPADDAEQSGRRLRATKQALCLVVALIAALPLVLGWGAGIDLAKRLLPDSAAIVPTTSLALLLVSGALFLDTRYPDRNCGAVCFWSGATLIGMGVASIILRNVTGFNGLSSFLVPGTIGSEGTAVATAAGMVIAGYCLACLNIPTPAARRSYEAAATAGLIFSLLAVVCYAFERDALFGISFFNSMSLPTATAFGLIFLVFLLVRRQETWLRHITSAHSGGRAARRLFLIMVVVPPVFCLVALKLVQQGKIDVGFAFSLLAVVFVVTSMVALVRTASLGNAEQLRRTIVELRALNDDKQVLLAEVYHRVKNNLQQMSAMIQLERSKVTDTDERERLDKILYRIRSVGVVHQMLVGSKSPSRVEVAHFLGELVDGLATGYNLKQRDIALKMDADDLTLPIDVAVPIGLLVNELVTNAIKHAFPDGRAGLITVGYHAVRGGLELSVADDGVGLADGAVPNERGLGTMIIKGLVNQLRGEVNIQTSGGTTAVVHFPINAQGGERK
ncbi:sensor histidine kinase [Acuticoccus sp. MNP-M23]|uniref:sensor histidine kinase n=1 Tax=Acuticoccus sp. MNP-M23 TaxID=3072793 RepID=UPI002814FA71|nr:sensor histidine kinase [Acuticoccus sp. MNP-M23]WMS43520.1 sensor histidine kinase [Acuticoccus sp. MNP-M23]